MIAFFLLGETYFFLMHSTDLLQLRGRVVLFIFSLDLMLLSMCLMREMGGFLDEAGLAFLLVCIISVYYHIFIESINNV